MKKILIITGTLNYGGVEGPLISSAKILAKDTGFKLFILNLSGLGELKNELKNTEIEYLSFDQKILRKNILKTIIKTRKLIKDMQPDIIHTHQFASNFYGSISAIGLGIPTIFHLYNPQMESLSRRIVRWILSKTLVKNFIVETENQKNLIAKSGIPKNKISVLYNSLNPERLTLQTNFDKEEYKRQLNIPEKSFVIGAVGRLAHEKGFDLLIEAFKKISRNNPEMFLIIVGDGKEEVKLKDLVKNIGIEKKVLFLGYRKDVANIMSLFNIVVVSSRTESFSLVAIEAMYLKKPVIITDRLLSKDLFKEVTITVPATVSGIKEGIESLMHDKQKLEGMGEKGRKLVEGKFTIDKYVEKLKIIYDGTLKQK